MRTEALTPKQLELLSCIYKYRFTSRQLIAHSLHIKADTTLHRRLKYLVKMGHIAERYEKKLSLLGKPIAYYLTSGGLRALSKQGTTIPESIVKQSYKDKLASQAFIDHNMTIHAVSNTLSDQYPTLRAFTKREMTLYDYFPSNRPDAFYSLPIDGGEPIRFFLDIVTAYDQRYQFEQLLNNYLQYFEADGWEPVSDTLPTLLFIAESSSIERRVKSWAHRLLTNKYDLTIEVLTTTLHALNSNAPIIVWSSIDPDHEQLLNISGSSQEARNE